MSQAEIAKITAEVSLLKEEIVTTQAKLEGFKSAGFKWTAEGRQKIVRQCMEFIKPSIEVYIAKLNSVGETLKRLGSLDSISPAKQDFKDILKIIVKALEELEYYGDENDKILAKNLCTQVRGCQSKLG